MKGESLGLIKRLEIGTLPVSGSPQIEICYRTFLFPTYLNFAI